jgi:hypothetical protein
MVHVVLGGFFITLLSRSLRLSWLASCASAITFMFCSNTVSKFFDPAFLANSIYLPLMILFVLKIFETGRVKWAIALSIVVVLPLFAGWIQALVYSLYALAAFVAAIVIRMIFRKSADNIFLKRGLILLMFSAVLSFALSAFQVFPVTEMGLQATRSFGGISEEMLTINGTAMYSSFRLAYDTFNSRGALLPFYLYVGMLPLLLSIVALWHRDLRFYVFFLYGLAVCALILSMGPQTPLFKLWMNLPLAGMFRAPFRFLFLHAVAVSILCGIGLDRFLQGFAFFKTARKKTVMMVALGTAATCALLFLVWPASGTDQPAAIKVVLAASHWRIYLLMLSLLIFCLVAVPRVKQVDHYLLGLGCIGLIMLDLFIANHNRFYLPENNPQIHGRHDRVIEKIRSLADIDKSRVFIVADMLDFSYCIKFGLLKKLPLINDYENMNPTIYNRYCNFMFGKDDRKSREFFWGWFNLDDTLVHPELLNYMSTKYIWFSRAYLDRDGENVKGNYLQIAGSCDQIYMDDCFSTRKRFREHMSWGEAASYLMRRKR